MDRQPQCIVFDVGQGNSAALVDSRGCTLIDVAIGPLVERALQRLGVTSVDLVIVSHADDDHCSGLVPLLLDGRVKVQRVILNSDPRGTRIWDELDRALGVAIQRDGTELMVGLSTTTDLPRVHDAFRVEVVSPLPQLVMRGVGSRRADTTLSANSLSAAIRVWQGDEPAVLFAADMDAVALRSLTEAHADLHATTLVYPHHGGHSGPARDPSVFARALVEAVDPKVVIFSVGRGKKAAAQRFPRADIVRSVRETRPDCHIACTQLARQCANELPTDDPTHLSTLPSRAEPRRCCAGTMEIDVANGLQVPTIASHTSFVQQLTARMCL